MAIQCTRTIINVFDGDSQFQIEVGAAQNTVSPGQYDVRTLAIGANTITPPSGGTTPVAVTIIPPSGNTETITLKGVSGDTGVVLHKTDPTSIGLNSPTSTFVLTCSAQIAGVRFIWS